MEEAKSTQPEPGAELKEAIEATSDFVMPEKGEKIKGTIISISDSAVLVDCGSKSEAILDPRELDGQAIGDEIEGVVSETEPSLKISIKMVSSKDNLEDFKNAFQNEIPVNGKITREIKGGFDVEIAGKRAFLPLRHLDVNFVQDTSPYIGESYDFKIIELHPENNKFVVSRAELLKKSKEESAQKAWEQIEVGAKLSGTVSSIQDFGAFVDLGGVDGLVHISELSQGYINHPSEMLQLGQQGRPPARLVDGFADMAVEVAIGALGLAEGPMDVECQFGRGGISLGLASHRGVDLGGHTGASKQAATSLAKARARWLMACLAAGSISPKVRSWPSGRNMGS